MGVIAALRCSKSCACQKAVSGYFTCFPSADRRSSFRESAPKSAAALARMRVVLVRTTHPGNIGAAARAMCTMGLARLVLVVAANVFPIPRPTALATGATERARARAHRRDAADALAGCALAIGLSARPRAFAGRVLPIREAAREIVERATDGDVALVFGTEMSGLSNEELAQCGDRGDDPGQSRLSVAQSRGGGAGRGVRAAHRGRRASGVGGAAFRARPTTRSRRCTRTPRRTLTALRFLESGASEAPACRGCAGCSAARGLEREEVNILRGILARVDQFVSGTRAVGTAASSSRITSSKRERHDASGGNQLRLGRRASRAIAHAATPTTITSSDHVDRAAADRVA